MSESILSLSEFKADASRLLDKIRDEPGTLFLTQNGRARAVLDGRRDLRSLLLQRLVHS